MEGKTEAEGEEAAEGGVETRPGQRPPPGSLTDTSVQTQRIQVPSKQQDYSMS